MAIELPQTARDMQSAVRGFVTDVVEPVAAQVEATGVVPDSLLKSAAEIGLFGLGIPEQYGGAGTDLLHTVVALEALAHGPGGVTMLIGPSAPAAAICLAGSEEQRLSYLPDLASGRRIAAYALTESEAGSDISAIRTHAARAGSGWVLSGSKLYISRARVASLFVVSAKTRREEGKGGISVFIIEKADGVVVGQDDIQLGLRGSGSAEVHFDNLYVDENRLLGELDQGLDVLKTSLTRARLWASARSIGAMAACLDLTLLHVGTRTQFGRHLGEFQAVRMKLADMATDLAAARLLVYTAAEVLDAGRDGTQETSIAKLFATEAAGRVADTAVQLHGALGVSKGYPIERFFRDVRAYRILDGASDIQRLVISSGLRRHGTADAIYPGRRT
jgi:acyl-CoA dehydrogenase